MESPRDSQPRTKSGRDSLHLLDRTLHVHIRQLFRFIIPIITLIIFISWIIRLIFNGIYSSKESSTPPLTFPSFDTLDQLRRPFLSQEQFVLFSFSVLAFGPIMARWIVGRMDKTPVPSSAPGEEEELPALNDMWHTFHITSCIGYSPQLAMCAIEHTFTFVRDSFKMSPLSMTTSKVKAVLKAVFLGFWTLLNLALGVAVPIIFLRQGKLLLEGPRCRLYPELFSSSVSPSHLLNDQEPLFPNSKVVVQEDGQVVVNGTILYTQGMDRALFTTCAMESVAYFGGGLVGLMLAYQLILRWCWFGAAMYRKVREGGLRLK